SSGTTLYFGKLFEIRPGNLRVNHVFAGDKGIADIIQDNNGTQAYYPILDHLNSLSLTTNSNAQPIQEIHYKPFGETAVETGTSSIQRKFTSQQQDTETDFYDYGARQYDSKLGIFITCDPELLASNLDYYLTPKNLGIYTYAHDNPLRY